MCVYVRLCVLSWENKDVYARAVRNLRLRELQNVECMTAVRAGLSSIIPLQLLTMLTPLEMELRTCGLPFINLEFLKVMNTRGKSDCTLHNKCIDLSPPQKKETCWLLMNRRLQQLLLAFFSF